MFLMMVPGHSSLRKIGRSGIFSFLCSHAIISVNSVTNNRSNYKSGINAGDTSNSDWQLCIGVGM